jgi:hypothetical protein
MHPIPRPAQSPEPLWLKETPAAPSEARPAGQAEEETKTRSPEAPLCCAKCGHIITRERHRTTVNGRHLHTRVNPSGYIFHFGCFAQAEGCLVLGPPTTEASWFAGHAWRYAMCAECETHLGWAFHGEGDFFGLVADRLTAPD